MQPRFEVSSRTTLRREIWELYEEEKAKLKMFMSKQCARSRELIAKHVEACLNNWELKRVLSITVDNATTNDVGVQYLKRRMLSWNCLVLKGDYVHMRCCAHILSLIVKDGLKEIKDSISKIRSAIKYVKSSPARFARFKACVKQEGISYQGIVCLDVETWWNSTYQYAFVLLDMQDKKFGIEMAKSNGGVPLEDDWEYVRIRQYSESDDVSIKLMSMRMKVKNKLDFVNYFIDYLFESSMASELKAKLLSSLKKLYEQYQSIEEGSQSSQQESQLDDDDDPHCMNFYLKAMGRRFDYISELDKYLREDPKPYIQSVEFDILHWWKVNSTRFPILSNMAREVLAILISTIASECAFSTGGRVVSPYRSCLMPKIVEVLVCTQDWLKGTPFSILFDEDPKKLDKFEQGVFTGKCGTNLDHGVMVVGYGSENGVDYWLWMGVRMAISRWSASMDSKRVILFSYGSGLNSTMFSLQLREGQSPFSLSNIVKAMDFDGKLKSRHEFSPEKFVETMKLMKRVRRRTFYLIEVNYMYRRFYAKKSSGNDLITNGH
ncbi:hypothetical protein V8G54_006139 [Vigna mungo]|uniref:Transposase n=1 Tax=Vigna mungo TaxID=3915 RepID=A0AAQ3P1N3_VIGMU